MLFCSVMAVVAVGIIISEKLDILILCSWGEERRDEIMEQILIW